MREIFSGSANVIDSADAGLSKVEDDHGSPGSMKCS